MSLFTINEQQCTKDGICVSENWTIVQSREAVRRVAAAAMEWAKEAVRNPEMAWAGMLIDAWERGEDPICRSRLMPLWGCPRDTISRGR